MAKIPTPTRLQFGPFLADFCACELRKDGRKIRLQEKPMLLLGALTANPGEVVSREELQKQLWPGDTFVDFETGLNAAVRKLREALTDNPENPRYIETIPKRGYRFLGQIDSKGINEPSISSEKPAPKVELITTSLGRRTIASMIETVSEYRRAKRVWMIMAAAFGLGCLALTLVELNVVKVVSLHGRVGASDAPAIRSIAVLPLQNLSTDPAQEFFSDGMTDALITDLSQIGSLRVISRTSIVRYKRTDKSLPKIARELNVDWVVEGTVQRFGDRVRITAQLIEARTDRHVWARTYERDLRDVLSLQDEVAQAIGSEIKIKLTPLERSYLASARPVNPDVYGLYLKGRFFLNQRTPEGLRNAVAQFTEAVERDNGYAPAYAGLSESYSLLHYYYAKPRREVMTQEKAAALRAVALDDSSAETHTALGQTLVDEWSWPEANKEFQRAIQLNPNYSLAHLWYSWLLQYQGQLTEAAAEAERAMELDPLGAVSNANLGYLYAERRDYDQAIKQLLTSSELSPDYADPHLELANVFFLKHQAAQGYAELGKAAELSGQKHFALCVKAATYAYARVRFLKSMEALAECRVHASTSDLLSSYDTAVEYAFAENQEKTLEWLERAYREHDEWLPYVGVDPALEELHRDPRYQDLLDRMNLQVGSSSSSFSHN